MPAEKYTLFQDSTQPVKKSSGISKQKIRDSLIAILVLQWYFKAAIVPAGDALPFLNVRVLHNLVSFTVFPN
jgi:hypothetical protein